MARRSIVAIVAVSLVLAGVPTGLVAGADPTPSTTTMTTSSTESITSTTTAASTGSWVIVSGRGFGHGVGMAQDGAYWMSRQGRSSTEILRLFYPGTSLGRRNGDVRVPLTGGGRVVITLPSGGTVAGRRLEAGASVTVVAEGSGLLATIETVAAPALLMTPIAFRGQAPEVASVDNASPSSPTTSPAPVLPPSVPAPPGAQVVPEPATAPSPSSPSSAAPPAEPAADAGAPTPTDAAPTTELSRVTAADRLVVEAAADTTLLYSGKPYRGRLELSSQGGVRVVNELDVEEYLRGMAEITDSGWPQAALEAQAIAARTYAFRTMASAGQVCPTQRCQVYVGAKAEYPAMDKAVAATRAKVVTYAKGKLAVTFYSASGGGTIATPEEAFGGGGDFPYLQAGTYPTGDLKSWVVSLTLNELARRVGYRGTASEVLVTKVGPSGRAINVTVSGSAGTFVVPGPKFDAALGLRSTFFTLQRSDSAAVPDATADVVPLAPIADGSSVAPFAFSQSELFEAPTTSPPSDPTPESSAPRENSTPGRTSTETKTVSTMTTAKDRRAGAATTVRVDTSHRATDNALIGALTFFFMVPFALFHRRRRRRSAR